MHVTYKTCVKKFSKPRGCSIQLCMMHTIYIVTCCTIGAVIKAWKLFYGSISRSWCWWNISIIFSVMISTVVLELNDVIIQWTFFPLLTNSWHTFWSFVSYFLPLNGGTVTDNSKQRTTGKRQHSRCEGSDSTKGKLIHRSVWRKVMEWKKCDFLMNHWYLQLYS